MEQVGTLVSMAVVGMLAGGLLLLVFDLARRRRAGVAADARRLLIVAGVYTLVLVTTGVTAPRRVLAPGEPDCVDDWCVAGGDGTLEAPGSVCGAGERNVWRVTLEVFDRGWGLGRAGAGASVEIEDGAGRRYAPCDGQAGDGPALSDRLEDGESFTVSVPVALPPGERPAGAVVHHAALPYALILGSGGALLHTPALLRLALR